MRVCACVCVCVRACVRMCVCVCVNFAYVSYPPDLSPLSPVYAAFTALTDAYALDADRIPEQLLTLGTSETEKTERVPPRDAFWRQKAFVHFFGLLAAEFAASDTAALVMLTTPSCLYACVCG